MTLGIPSACPLATGLEDRLLVAGGPPTSSQSFRPTLRRVSLANLPYCSQLAPKFSLVPQCHPNCASKGRVTITKLRMILGVEHPYVVPKGHDMNLFDVIE